MGGGEKAGVFCARQKGKAMTPRWGLAFLLLWTTGIAAQENDPEVLPRPTQKGTAGLQELVKHCVEGGALKFLPRTKAGPSRLELTDAMKLRRILEEHRDLLTEEVSDTLLTTSQRFDQSVLLEAVAEFRKDDKLRGFSALARGESLESEGNYPEAVKRYAEASRRFSALKFPSWQARTLSSWGGVLNAQGDHESAMEKFTDAHRLIEKARGAKSVQAATALTNLGWTASLMRRTRLAIGYHRKALEVLEQQSEEPLRELIATHRNLGALLLTQKDVAAIEHDEIALKLARKIPVGPDRTATVGSALANLGHAHQVLKQFEQAKRYYEDALELLKTDGNGKSDRVAMVLRNLGGLHFDRGDRRACLDCLSQSLQLFLDLHGDRSWEVVQGFDQLASANLHFGDHKLAARYYEKVGQIARLLGGDNHPWVAESLGGLASTALETGDHRHALELVKQELALRQLRATQRPGELANAWNRLGQIEHRLGRDGEAVPAFQEALKLWTDLHGEQHALTASGWHNLGTALNGAGQSQRALDALKKALEIREKVSPRNEADIADSLNSLGSFHYLRQEYGKALEYHLKAWEIHGKLSSTSRYMRAATLNNVAMSHFGLRQWADARKRLDEAIEELRIQPRLKDPPADSAQAIHGFGPDDLMPSRLTVQVLHQRGMTQLRQLSDPPTKAELSDASFTFIAAISVLERLRGHVLVSEEGRWEIGEGFADLHALIIGCQDRLLRRDDLSTESRKMSEQIAYKAAELSTARAFLRSLARSRADMLVGLDPVLRKRRTDLDREVQDLDALLSHEQAGRGLDRNFDRVVQLMEQRRLKVKAQEDWLAEVHKRYPRFDDIQSPVACSIADARSCLDQNEAALLYVLGNAESYVVVLDREQLSMTRLPKAADIAEWVETVLDRENLGSIRTRSLEAEGYRMLLGPVAERIKGKDLVIVPSGVLCHLPFEILVEGMEKDSGKVRYLIENRRIRYAPSMTVLHVISQWEAKRIRPDRKLWAMGDPVYEEADERVKGVGKIAPSTRELLAGYLGRGGPDQQKRFQRLPFSGRELEEIQAVCAAPADDILTGVKATEATLKEHSRRSELLRFRYLHFAAHGILGSNAGRQPSLVLSLVGANETEKEDGFLQLDEVMQLKLNADLVVLSACETGRGRQYDVEGVRGLSRAFLHAGSRGVVCSLWQVSDRETPGLMKSFYRELINDREAAQALRSGKLEMIRAGKPPLYWAPFILLGR
jgi:CHAT domain-containing protein/tetratricopeptide (TPR) repeat protein